MRALSYSSISTYQQCPLLYKLKYVEGREEEKKFYLSWGKSLHGALEFLYGVKVPPPPTLTEVLEHYERNWLSEGYDSLEQEEKYRREGRRILKEFYAANIPAFQPPVAVERRFSINVNGVKLAGFFDRIDKSPAGKLHIIDYKSSQMLFDKNYLEDDLQLTLYQLAAEELWDLEVGGLTLYHLRSNTPCTVGPRPRRRIEAARKLVVETAEKIQAGEFAARENQFCPCDWPQACPYYRDLYPAAQTKLTPAGLPDRGEIKQLVEEYAELKEEQKELKDELVRIGELIQRFAEAENLKRIYGKSHAVTISEARRLEYDARAAREILEPLGLWSRVLTFDQKALRSLLRGDELPASARAALTALRREKLSRRLTVKKLIDEELSD